MFPLGSCIGSAYEFFIRHLKCWIPLHDEPIFCQFNFFHCPNVGVLATVKVLALSSDIYWSVAFQCMHAHFAKCFAHTIFSLLQRRMFCHWPDRRSGQQTRERLEPWDQGWIIFLDVRLSVASTQMIKSHRSGWDQSRRTSRRKKRLGERMVKFELSSLFQWILTCWKGMVWKQMEHHYFCMILLVLNLTWMFLGWWTGTDSINHLSQLCPEQTF